MSMLRRHSTNSRKDIERRKSTSSVRSVHLEHFDNAAAQRDARIAATQAFARNQRRHTAEMPLFQLNMPSTRRTNESATASSSFRTSRVHALTDPSDCRDDADLHRRHSVRFVAPAPDKRRLSCQNSIEQTGRASNEYGKGSSETHHRCSTDTAPETKVLQNTQNTQNQMPTYGQGGPATSKLASSFIQALAAEEEYYTPEDDIASMPSSYRRLRRSKSMFPQEISAGASASEDSSHLCNVSVRPRLQASLTNPSILSSATAKENVYPVTGRMVHSLRAPKSMSFLRRCGRSEPVETRHFEAYTPWAGLRIGEQTVPTQPSVRQHGSLFSWSRNKKSESGLVGIRKSLRSSSTSSGAPPALPSASLTLPTDGTIRDKARKASRSFKTKIKTLFRSSKSETSSAGIPEQHIEARHTYVAAEDETPRALQETPHVDNENASISHLQPKIPALRSAISHPILRSQQGSTDSLRTDTDGKSRVTSWTSSNPTTDTVLHEAKSEWEKQRLSVINEGGAHCPSRSALRQTIDTEACMTMKGSFIPERPAPMPPGAPIDSQRIYSALMKRANGFTQIHRDGTQDRRPSTSLSDPFRTASPGSSSAQSRMALVAPVETSPTTIRCVPSSTEKLSEMDSDPWAVRDEMSPRSQDAWAEGMDIVAPRPLFQKENQHNDVRSFLSSPSPEEPEFVTAVGATALSPFADPPVLSGSPLNKGIADAGTGFFASPNNHLFRTTSPYRRALRASMRAAGDTGPSMQQRGAVSGNTYQSDMDGHSERQDSLYSESVYSYQTGDDQTNTKHQGKSDGLAITPYNGLDCPQDKQDSSDSSEEWKSWLAANVSKLEPQSTPGQFDMPLDDTSPTHRESRIFGFGHVRERTQICPDDDDHDPFHPPATGRSMPTTPIRTVGRTMWPTLTAPQSLPQSSRPSELPREKSPLRRQSVQKGPPGPPPPIPPKSARRLAQASSSAKIPMTELYNINTTTEEQPATPDPRVAARRTQSLARMRSLNRLRATATGSPFAPMSTSATLTNRQNLASGLGITSLPSGTSSPGLSAAVERQFGATVPVGGRQYGDDKENSPRPEAIRSGSKAMVDDFLRSRRRGISGDVEEEEGEGSGRATVFI